MASSQCAPGFENNNTCFTMSALKQIAGKINKNTKYNSIPNIDINKYNKANKSELINKIQQKLNCSRNIDMCVLDKKSDFYKEIRTFFKPKNPGKTNWLSTVNIKTVMDQYQKIYSDFMFFGPVPIDFADFSSAVSRLNFKKLAKSKKRIGIIFNTDPSYKSGEHWISMFIDFKNNTLCFFDSGGDTPPPEVKRLMKKIATESKKVGVKLSVLVNQKEFQKNEYSCGVYSIYFMVMRLKGNSCSSVFNSKLINDKMMKKVRTVIFRK